MDSSPAHEITALLQAWNRGDQEALEKVTPLIYEELHRAAKRCLSGCRRDQTLQATALINELYLRVLGMNRISWQNRAHFFAICARQMRWILTDFYRAKQYQKRGAGAERVSLDESAVLSRETSRDLLAIDQALTRLAVVDQRKSQVVELRFFGGLSVKETAEVLKVSPHTVMRDWKLARAWLLSELSNQKPHGA
ncbi:MAG TPA: sigma-70 family RNA polymerase sigma factor [Terriglobales bacterium]|jgi:RNA polymerase sigma factor (TIGR02999 family)|nr:sigma-70 family RNA polymerase sigma factor [Terriglobales bacterium]